MGKKAAILVVILAAGLGFGYFFGIAKNKKEIKTEDVVAAAGDMPASEDAIKDFRAHSRKPKGCRGNGGSATCILKTAGLMRLLLNTRRPLH